MPPSLYPEPGEVGVTCAHTTHSLPPTMMPMTSSHWVMVRFPLPPWDVCAQPSVVEFLHPFLTSFEGKMWISTQMCRFCDPGMWPTWKGMKHTRICKHPFLQPQQSANHMLMGAPGQLVTSVSGARCATGDHLRHYPVLPNTALCLFQ